MTHKHRFSFAALLLVVIAAGSAIAQTPAKPVVPEAVNGWREYPLRDGVISIQKGKWRTDKIAVPVTAGKGLEYKLTMKKGEGLVYNISYGTLGRPEDDADRVSRPHRAGERRRRPDVLFEDGWLAESGVFTAPWDGIHGWYLKNDSPKDVVVTLDLAGFLLPSSPSSRYASR